ARGHRHPNAGRNCGHHCKMAGQSVEIPVELGERRYLVVVADDETALGRAAQAALGDARPSAIVADSTADHLHGARLRAALERAGFSPLTVVALKPGEPHKTLAAVERACEALAHAGLDRGSPVFTLGGGVACDVGGFVAASFLRGVPFVHLPTTL